MASEYANKDAFAEGFAGALKARSIRMLDGTGDAWHHAAFKRDSHAEVTSDAAFLIEATSKLAKRILVIIELECSAPGNEPNILKWFEAVEAKRSILLKRGSIRSNCVFDEVLLYMAFVQAGHSFSERDLHLGMRMCNLVKTLISHAPLPSGIQFEIQIDRFAGECRTHRDWDQWHCCGRSLGEQFVALLKV